MRVINVITAGPQGPPGPQGPQGTPGSGSVDTSSFATTGSNSFIGTQRFSGSLIITGSVIVSGSNTFTNIGPAIFSGSIAAVQGITGSIFGTATTASYISPTFISASAASSGFGGGTSIDTSSFATTKSLNDLTITVNSLTAATSSYVTNSITSSMSVSSASFASTASYIQTAQTASYVLNSISSSFSTTASYWSGSILNSTSASFASTASFAPLYLPLIGGTISGNLNVIGTASFSYTTASIVQVGANTITLNTDNPASRFGGITVVDSGSFGNSSTGSLLWDSQNNKWVYSNPSGSSYDGGMLISGPRNTSGLGNETGMDVNFVAVGQGSDHIAPGTIYNSGSITQITGSLMVTAGITGSLLGTASYASQALSSSYALTASYVGLAQTASYVLTAQTASYVLQAVSSSFASTASYWSGSILNATSASYALTASYALNSAGGAAFPFTGSAGITGSLTVTGSIYTNGIIYSPFTIALNFTSTSPYTFIAPYAFSVSSSESIPSGSITVFYQASGSATSSSYSFGSTVNKFDNLIITPPAVGLVILNSNRL